MEEHAVSLPFGRFHVAVVLIGLVGEVPDRWLLTVEEALLNAFSTSALFILTLSVSPFKGTEVLDVSP